MDKIIKKTKVQFVAVITIVIIIVVGLSWGILQAFNINSIGTPAHLTEIQKPAIENEAYAQYLNDQKAYEAHFITLASSIKQQEQERLTKALALTAILSVAFGVIIAVIASNKLTKPVVKAYESQERFIQDAAHELRNPLAAMTLAIQQTKQTGPLITVFKRQTKRLININEDLLYLERKSNNLPEITNISELTADVIEELHPLAKKKQITIVQKIDSEIYKKIAPNDYVKLVKNIVDNAIKYSNDNSKINLSVIKSKNVIKITVKDFGIGIPADEKQSIGKRFFRASNTGVIEGTGLGLAIVQKILNIYGGTIKITSKQNLGTSVEISLPA
jgi:signal transduction histidine kinase